MGVIRLLRTAAASAVLLLLLTGIPAGLLLAYQAAPVTLHWRTLLGQPATLPLLWTLGTSIGWMLWAWLVYAVTGDVLDRFRARPQRRTRLPAPLHHAVTTVTGSVLLATSATTGVANSDTVALDRPTAAPTDRAAPTATSSANGGPTPAASAGPSFPAAPMPDPNPVPAGIGVHAVDLRGISLPGGWLPAPAATAVAAAAALLWAHRRRRYRPQPLGRARRTDPDVEPQPPPLALLQRRVTALDHATDLIDAHLAGTDGALTDVPSFDDSTPASVFGVNGNSWLSVDDLPATGLGLLGPGAADAARGLLTAVVAGHAAHRAGTAVVVITASDLQRLLGTVDTATQMPGLCVTADATAAIDVFTDRPAGQHRPVPDEATRVLLLAQPPPTQLLDAVQTLLRQPAPRIRVVLLSSHPTGTNWYVHADGHANDTQPATGHSRRLAVLTKPTCLALLHGLRQPAAPATQSRPPPRTTATADAAEPRPVAAGTAPGWVGPPLPIGQPRRLVLRVLGTPTVRLPHPDGSDSVVHIRRTAGMRILLYLAIHRAGARTDELLEALWPDIPVRTANSRFNTTISELRRALRTAAQAHVVRHTTNPTAPTQTWHWLDPAHIHVDLWHLHDALDAADAATDSVSRTASLHSAAEVCTGDLAPGLIDAWLQPAREATAQHMIDLYTHLADTEPDHHAAIVWLRRAIGIAPHTEALYQQVMRRHAAAGQHDAVRRTLATLTARLADIHTQPATHTQQLAADLLAGDAAATTLTRDPAASTRHSVARLPATKVR